MRRYNFKEINDVYGKISPFEFKDKLIKLAKFRAMESGRRVLDAGRGNPNWTAATPREAFFTFGQFAVNETRRTWNEGDLAGMPKKEGIATRFYQYIYDNLNMPGANLAKDIVDYGIEEFDFDPDSWVFELADAIIGDNYPSPDRILVHIEQIVTKYLIKEMKYDTKKGGPLSIFAVEGATAAMCYIFDSLMANELLRKGDKIAIMTPIFTPYLEIPHLPRYNFDVVFINADEIDENNNHTWQYSKKELEKLCDKSIKALFLVNPNNPASIALDENSCNNLVDVVTNHHPNLMIISDDVYGTFVPGFKSLMASLPYNTIGAYSFSKYFGVTGWRLGTLALHENNVFEKLINELPDDLKASVNKRYSDMSLNPDKISFMDRIVADSRMVALNHTAGLSTPQQVQMAFFSAFALIDKDDNYKGVNISICKRRQKLFYDALGVDLIDNKNDASYYVIFDIMKWATNNYGEDFANFIKDNYKPADMLFKLANNYSIVLLSGHGFFGPEWSVRVSLANLDDESYTFIGNSIKEVLSFYVYTWKKNK
ncbi:aspartate 4-decarboxylase [Paraclostridium bifermentans]|uniref:aspartate 4-decarboxylase n=1 Tax=Paraclostridium bifermentans TaxID=1490 RepID=UPI00038C7789|nr:aspartate 4-decarboxylase [Paraclostridium bifermentans]EQK47463.1 aspartate 4-decarboxylase [[Clostridium] bifermentans ATCC 19299] [Paraclostridium bifermentans ATCC 19299]MCE9674518.1 aspartate 4-decarboxylase [Paraclostridium bifermentans]TQO58032.1 aspartate 4-decarboxylase [Paraclostridium bifermentans]GKZ01698.1 aminotransferase [Paraclostridium bifermentans]GKZ06483.1 aminotransferase [Paraclostridium bifermentans]